MQQMRIYYNRSILNAEAMDTEVCMLARIEQRYYSFSLGRSGLREANRDVQKWLNICETSAEHTNVRILGHLMIRWK